MKDILIFLAGMVGKAILGMLIGACVKRGVKTLDNERKAFITKHYKDSHGEDIKYCQRDTCAQLV